MTEVIRYGQKKKEDKIEKEAKRQENTHQVF